MADFAASLDINSSDFEDDAPLDPPPNAPGPNVGKRMAQAIQDNQATDRPASKRSYRTLTFAYGAIGTQNIQRRVQVAWDTFCATIKHDPKICPSGEDVYRFIDTIARNTIPGIRGKVAPQLGTVKRSWGALVTLLTMRHPEFEKQYRQYDIIRIRTNLDQLARDGNLLRGKWRKKQYIGFRLVKHMAREWLRKALQQGCANWDRHLHRSLCTLVQAVTGMRIGDLTRSNGYKGLEFLPWKDLEIYLKTRRTGSVPSVQDLELKITLRYTKGKKNLPNDNTVRFVEPMADTENNAVCLVKLLIVTALRHGKVPHTNIEDLLQAAAQRHDGKIIWSKPDEPVLFAMGSGTSSVRYDKPISAEVVRHSLRQISLNAGVLVPLVNHDYRRGFMRDMAYAGREIQGAPSRAVAFIAGHSNRSLHNGTTGEYIGPNQQQSWNLRAENEKRFIDKLAPALAPPSISRKRATTNQLNHYMDEHGLKKSRRADRQYAGSMLGLAELNKWAESAEGSMPKTARYFHPITTPKSATTPSTISPAYSSEARATSSSTIASESASTTPSTAISPTPGSQHLTAPSPRVEEPAMGDDEFGDGEIDDAEMSQAYHDYEAQRNCPHPVAQHPTPAGSAQTDSYETRSQHRLADVPLSDIDPQLTEGFFEDAEVDADELNEVQDMIEQTAGEDVDQAGDGDHGHGDDDEGEDSLDEDELNYALGTSPVPPSRPATLGQHDQSDILLLSGNEFVSALAAINTFARCKHHSKEQLAALDMPRGNSRDEPTQFLFYCQTTGCEYTHYNQAQFNAHQISCTPEKAFKENQVRCRFYPECTSVLADVKGEQGHFRDVHEFEPVSCPKCPEDKQHILYDTKFKLRNHDIHSHNHQDLICPYVDVCHANPFVDIRTLRLHLRVNHLKTQDEAATLAPSLREVQRVPLTCPLIGTSNPDCIEGPWETDLALRQHLAGFHNKSPDEVDGLVPFEEEEEPYDDPELEPTIFPCPLPACSSRKAFTNLSSLRAHLRSPIHSGMSEKQVHSYAPGKIPSKAAVPKKELLCPKSGCEDRPVFAGLAKLRSHLRSQHSCSPEEVEGIAPFAGKKKAAAKQDFRCPMPRCEGFQFFPDAWKLRRHLMGNMHRLSEEQAEAIAPFAGKKKAAAKQDFRCPKPGCEGLQPFPDASKLRRHLMDKMHGLSEEQAEAIAPFAGKNKAAAKKKLRCPKPGCEGLQPFPDVSRLRRHLMGKMHGLSEEQAAAIVPVGGKKVAITKRTAGHDVEEDGEGRENEGGDNGDDDDEDMVDL